MIKEREKSESFIRGLKTRRKVLGDSYVDRNIEQASDFSWEVQILTTEWCWDKTWNRSGLDHRTRSFINLGMIAALNRPHEFKTHVRGALHNGITPAELKEVLLQIGTYCGIPAAMDCFRLAGEVLKDMEIA